MIIYSTNNPVNLVCQSLYPSMSVQNMDQDTNDRKDMENVKNNKNPLDMESYSKQQLIVLLKRYQHLDVVSVQKLRHVIMTKIINAVLKEFSPDDVVLFGGAVRDRILHNHNQIKVSEMKLNTLFPKEYYRGGGWEIKMAENHLKKFEKKEESAIVPRDLDFLCKGEIIYNKVIAFLTQNYDIKIQIYKTYGARPFQVTRCRITPDCGPKINVDLILCNQNDIMAVDADVNFLTESLKGISTVNNFFKPIDTLIMSAIKISPIITNICRKEFQIITTTNEKSKEEIEILNRRFTSLIHRGWTCRSANGRQYVFQFRGTCQVCQDSDCGFVQDVATPSTLTCFCCWNVFDELKTFNEERCPICLTDFDTAQCWLLSCKHKVHLHCQIQAGLKCSICRRSIKANDHMRSKIQDAQTARRNNL